MAEKILMSEFKALSKEPWTNIEVCSPLLYDTGLLLAILTLEPPAHQREHLSMACRPHGHQPRLDLQWRLLQGQDDIPSQLPLQPSWYVVLPSPSLLSS